MSLAATPAATPPAASVREERLGYRAGPERAPAAADRGCQECGAPLVRASGCAHCPACGWGRCG